MPTKQAALATALEKLGWPRPTAAQLARGAHVVRYDRRSTVFTAGETADLAYILLDGRARIEFGHGSGGALLVSIAEGGAMLGVFAPYPVPPAVLPEQVFTARAMSRCSVAILPTARMIEELSRLTAVQVIEVLERGRRQWMDLSSRMLAYLTMNVRQRLVSIIGQIAERFGEQGPHGCRIGLRLSHGDLASLIGASRPIVTRHVQDLIRAGVLIRDEGFLTVAVPLPALAALADGGGVAVPVDDGVERDQAGAAAPAADIGGRAEKVAVGTSMTMRAT